MPPCGASFYHDKIIPFERSSVSCRVGGRCRRNKHLLPDVWCVMWRRQVGKAGESDWLFHMQMRMKPLFSAPSLTHFLFVPSISKPPLLSSSRHISFLQSSIPLFQTVALSALHCHLTSAQPFDIIHRPVEIFHLLWLPLTFSLSFWGFLKLLQQKIWSLSIGRLKRHNLI